MLYNTQLNAVAVIEVQPVDLQLKLCDLEAHPFYMGMKENGLSFFTELSHKHFQKLINFGLRMIFNVQ